MDLETQKSYMDCEMKDFNDGVGNLIIHHIKWKCNSKHHGNQYTKCGYGPMEIGKKLKVHRYKVE